MIGDVPIFLLGCALDQLALQAKLGALVLDVDALLVEREVGHTVDLSGGGLRTSPRAPGMTKDLIRVPRDALPMPSDPGSELTRLPQFQDFAAHLEGIAVWAGDESGFDYMSPGFEDIWGIPVAEVMEDIWRVIEGVHPEDRDRVVRELEESVETLDRGERFETEHRVLRPDGDVRWVQTRVFPVHDEEGQLIETVGMAIDITEQKEAELALEKQNERLNRFAETVSHDLRNPLASATGYLELLDDSVDPDVVAKIDRALSRMDAMIEQVLTLARTGKGTVETAPVDLAAVIDAGWEVVATEDAVLTRNDDLGTIEAAPELLQRLFENLFRNAIEHAGPAVTVTVGRLEGDDSIFIEDDGPGMPPDMREDLFETDVEGATGGLGLVIVREVCDLHDWTIDVVPADGARFEISGFDRPT